MQGTFKAPINAISYVCLGIFRAHMGPYEPIWARPGPLNSGKSSGKTHLFKHIYIGNRVFYLQTRSRISLLLVNLFFFAFLNIFLKKNLFFLRYRLFFFLSFFLIFLTSVEISLNFFLNNVSIWLLS